MLTLVNTVEETMTHILYPVARQAVCDLLTNVGEMGRFQDEVYVMIDGDLRYNSMTPRGDIKLPKDRVDAKVTLNVNPANSKWDGGGLNQSNMASNQMQRGTHMQYQKMPYDPRSGSLTLPVLHDPQFQVTLLENGFPCSIQIELEFRMTEMVGAMGLLQKIQRYYTNGEMYALTSIAYDYPIPKTINAVMFSLAFMGGIPEANYYSWLQDKSNGQISMNLNRDNTAIKELVINRASNNALIQIEMSGDAPSLQDQFCNFNISLTIQFPRIDQLILNYPICIMNKPVPRSFVPMKETEKYRYNSIPIYRDNIITAGYHLFSSNNLTRPFQYPWWDQWDLPIESVARYNKHQLFFSSLITLDDIKNPTGVTTIDLANLGICTLTPEVLAQLGKQLPTDTLNYDAMIGVGLYADDLMVDPNLLSLNGTVLTIKSRRVDRVYRLALSISKESTHGYSAILPILRVPVTYNPNGSITTG